MKKNIGFVSLDSCLTEWLLEKLRLSAPDTPAAKELQEGLSELMNGTASSLMVEVRTQSDRIPRQNERGAHEGA